MIIIVVFVEFGQKCEKVQFNAGYTIYFGELSKMPSIIGIIAFSLVMVQLLAPKPLIRDTWWYTHLDREIV